MVKWVQFGGTLDSLFFGSLTGVRQGIKSVFFKGIGDVSRAPG